MKPTTLLAVAATALLPHSVSAVANWHMTGYSDNNCQNQVFEDGGNTPSGCRNNDFLSYRFTSTPDPRAGIRYVLTDYGQPNCQTPLTGSTGGTACFQLSQIRHSWQVSAGSF
ncbi:hypothetical protein NKR19_g6555 [Coniochaeta hoffmannii]|uniref:Secreted protein n=1 Tax=Coniochaeta hoffmannii TaxID=91930 RepID=A0AA38RE12_9PEZI|nr:hypothetical protein NKR19_g6555 [Coniochaeta hoffmannii]